MANRVRFVRFDRKLADIIGIPPRPRTKTPAGRRGNAAQAHPERRSRRPGRGLRIIVKTQQDLWDDGVRAEPILATPWKPRPPTRQPKRRDAGSRDERTPSRAEDWYARRRTVNNYGPASGGGTSAPRTSTSRSCAAIGNRFVALGEIAERPLRRQDRLRRLLHAQGHHRRDACKQHAERLGDFRRTRGRRARKDVESGKLKIVEAGDGSVHPIEAKYLAPEVHSLMKVDRPVVRAADVDRVVLLVGRAAGQTEDQVAVGLALPALWDDGNVRLQQVQAGASAASGPPVRRATRGTT